MSKRWDVEVRPDVFHDVGADGMHIEHGTLIFVKDSEIMLAYAPGHWITVTAAEDETP